jgi:hypothetical protein
MSLIQPGSADTGKAGSAAGIGACLDRQFAGLLDALSIKAAQ